MVDEPARLLIPTPDNRDQSMIVELVEHSAGSVQLDVGVDRDNIIGSRSSVGQCLDHAESFLPPKEACQSCKIIMIRHHTPKNPSLPPYIARFSNLISIRPQRPHSRYGKDCGSSDWAPVLQRFKSYHARVSYSSCARG